MDVGGWLGGGRRPTGACTAACASACGATWQAAARACSHRQCAFESRPAFWPPPACDAKRAAPCPALQDFETFFEPIFAMFAAQRRSGESLGDFTARVGFDAVRTFQASYIAPAAAEKLPKVRPAPPLLAPSPPARLALAALHCSAQPARTPHAPKPALADASLSLHVCTSACRCKNVRPGLVACRRRHVPGST